MLNGQTNLVKGGSPGLVVMGGGSQSKGRGFPQAFKMLCRATCHKLKQSFIPCECSITCTYLGTSQFKGDKLTQILLKNSQIRVTFVRSILRF